MRSREYRGKRARGSTGRSCHVQRAAEGLWTATDPDSSSTSYRQHHTTTTILNQTAHVHWLSLFCLFIYLFICLTVCLQDNSKKSKKGC